MPYHYSPIFTTPSPLTGTVNINIKQEIESLQAILYLFTPKSISGRVLAQCYYCMEEDYDLGFEPYGLLTAVPSQYRKNVKRKVTASPYFRKNISSTK